MLEIGSGTGQHAVYFAERFQHLQWQPSDVEENLPGIRLWRDDYAGVNLAKPFALNVCDGLSQEVAVDYVFSANTAHIMSWSEVELLFALVARSLKPDGRFCLYGPFNYHSKYTSESNQRFDQWLKNRDPNSGIRDFESIQKLACQQAMQLLDDVAMPANNRCLLFSKT